MDATKQLNPAIARRNPPAGNGALVDAALGSLPRLMFSLIPPTCTPLAIRRLPLVEPLIGGLLHGSGWMGQLRAAPASVPDR